MTTPFSPGRAPRWHWIVVLLVPLAVYLPSLGYGFLWDDWNNLVFSDHLKSWDGVVGSFLHPAMWSADSGTGAVATYRPLALASMALTHLLLGGAPLGHHAVSVLLHVATVAMVFRALRGLLPHPEAALFATLLWAIHPVNAEAVAWVNGRSEIFAAFGIAWAVDASRRGRSIEVAVATLFALLGKETGIVAVPAALLVRAVVLARPPSDWLRILSGSISGFALWFAARSHAVGGQSGSDAGSLLESGLPWVPSIIVLALEAMLVPLRTGVLVVRDAVLLTDPWLQLVHIVVTVVLLLGLAAAVLRRVAPLPVSLVLIWLASLAPPMALVSTGWAGFSRWLYVMGWAFVAALVAVGGAAWVGRKGRIVGAVLVAGLALLSLRANAVYRSDATLAQASIEDYPEQVFGYEMLAAEMMRVGLYAEALVLIDHARAWQDQRSQMQFPGSMRAFCLAQLDRCGEATAALAEEFEVWQPRRHGLSFLMIRNCWARTGQLEAVRAIDRSLDDAVREGRIYADQLRVLDPPLARPE